MRYFGKRIGYFLLTFTAAIMLNFAIPRLQPGDPAEIMIRNLSGQAASGVLDPAQVESIRAMLGVPDAPIWQQFFDYVSSLARGDMGISFAYFPFPVTHIIFQTLPWTFFLVGITQVISYVFGTILGAFAAWRRNSRFDSVVSIGSTFVGNLPSFWIGMIILVVFGFQLGWFPTGGGFSFSTPGWNWEFIQDAGRHMFLPALTLLITTPIGFILGMRNTMVMTLGEDYIKLAKAAGLPERKIALSYAARNALLPSVTAFAGSLAVLFGGSILIETVFDYPGMGRLMGIATGNRDYPLMQGLLLFTISAVLIGNLIADLLYSVLDPRVRKAS
ncbi:MAG: ABC transporter permease [Candidatus Nanopelagicales bacterium]